MLGVLTTAGSLIVVAAMAISGFVAADAPRALVRVRANDSARIRRR